MAGESVAPRSIRRAFLVAVLLAVAHVRHVSGLATDVQCLQEFKASVTDPEDYLNSWELGNSPSICDWAGIRCFGNSALPVYKLLLKGFRLSGTWPTAALAKCTSLQTIDFSFNHFYGPLPSNVCDTLPNLVSLDLRSNGFTGAIPANLGACKFLNELLLNINAFSGEIPAELALAPRLSLLNVSENDLSGVIPEALSALVPGTNVYRFNQSSFEGNAYLCGKQLPNPCRKLPTVTSKKAKTGMIVGGIVGGVVVVLVVLAAGFWWFLRRARVRAKEKQKQKVKLISKEGKRQLPGKRFTRDRKWIQRIRDPNAITVSMFEPLETRIGFTELMEGTNNFSGENIISANATGTVYKAEIPGETSSSTMAIKRLRVSSHNDKAFATEMEALANLKHRNLVPLLGYCVAAGERLLIYKHLPKGSLWDHLHPETGTSSLTWADRVKIATGTARALAFLHHSCDPRVLHRNVNTKAILLDTDNEPCITDFGLARLTNREDTHVSTFFNGDYGDVGYVAPETVRTFVATMKGDVYSFGVVLLELVTGQKAVDVRPTVGSSRFQGNLVQYVRLLTEEGTVVEAVDLSVKESGADDDEVLQILKVAVACVSEEPKERSSMFEIYQLLRAIGEKYNYTTGFADLPTLHEGVEHVDVHEAICVHVHIHEL